MGTEVKPDAASTASKKEQVEAMFDSIAFRYDFLNHFLSAGIDKTWRKKAINILAQSSPKHILDVATGTGDMAIEAHRRIANAKITGIDLSEGMLEFGRKKLNSLGLQNDISLIKGDSEKLPFEDNHFDACMVAFGVRNFENLDAGLAEMYRVIKPNAKLIILEFSKPNAFPFKQLYNFYFKSILPFWGKLFSKSKNAYSYLPESVAQFPDGEAFVKHLRNCQFKNIIVQPLTFGTCTLYIAAK